MYEDGPLGEAWSYQTDHQEDTRLCADAMTLTLPTPVVDPDLSLALMNFTLNGTLPSAPTPNRMSTIKTSVLSTLFVISLLCNSATLVQMYRMRRRRSTINTLILHLATADLIVTFFCFLADGVWVSTVQWLAGNIMCKLVKFLQVFGLYLSTYIVVIIAIDRAYAILDPMSRNKAPRRVRSMIITAWVLSAIFSAPQAYIFSVQRGPYRETFYQCVTFGAYNARWQEQMYSCISALLMFIIPLIIMITAYMLIFTTIAKKSRDLKKEREQAAADMLSQAPVRGELFQKAKVKSLKMTTLIVLAFIICWSPYYVIFLAFTFAKITPQLAYASMWIFCFGTGNSLLNPLIYGAFHVCSKSRKRQKLRRPGRRLPTPFPGQDTKSKRSSQTARAQKRRRAPPTDTLKVTTSRASRSRSHSSRSSEPGSRTSRNSDPGSVSKLYMEQQLQSTSPLVRKHVCLTMHGKTYDVSL